MLYIKKFKRKIDQVFDDIVCVNLFEFCKFIGKYGDLQNFSNLPDGKKNKHIGEKKDGKKSFLE